MTDIATVTDRVTDTYLRRSLDGDRGLLDAIDNAPFGPAFLAANGGQLLPRPLFVAEDTMVRFSVDLSEFFDLLTSLPRRLFDGDVAAYCAALGMEKQRAAILSRYPGKPTKYGRVDAYHDGDSLRLLEFNIGSALGGIDRAEIGRILLRVLCGRSEVLCGDDGRPGARGGARHHRRDHRTRRAAFPARQADRPDPAPLHGERDGHRARGGRGGRVDLPRARRGPGRAVDLAAQFAVPQQGGADADVGLPAARGVHGRGGRTGRPGAAVDAAARERRDRGRRADG